ncbi:MAG: HigA family addiction module antidote protein [Magnetococcales bacterium]|nr:HigA family addiction module antidote protein [Magnetococcales bacterium]
MNLPPIHPGEILQGELEELSLSANAPARNLDLPTNRITEILHGKRGITADTALRLARYFGTSARFWLNLQISYDLTTVEQNHGKEIAEKVSTRAAW